MITAKSHPFWIVLDGWGTVARARTYAQARRIADEKAAYYRCGCLVQDADGREVIRD